MGKIYFIGNTHFDPVWMWCWDEAMSSITATFRSAIQRMKDYPDFRYSFATPPVFEWIKKTDPELFEEIKEYVKKGQWELAEGWWLQPDCYSAQGESYVRQGLYGQRWLTENFGERSVTVFNADSFGHPPTFPQILQKSGIKYYVFSRPEGKHIDLPHYFTWESKDGSTVTAARDDMMFREASFTIDRLKDDTDHHLTVYGVTDHGGAPTIRDINEIEKCDYAQCATVKDFFESVTAKETVTKELLTGDFGPYVNHIEIKKNNRKAEYAALFAERASILAGSYDKAAITKVWEDIMFNQFHDILGGACIKDAYFDARNLHGRAIQSATEIMHYNLQKLDNRIAMPGKNPDNPWNIVVWNLNTFDFDGYVEAEVQWMSEFLWYMKGIKLEDAEGNTYGCQIILEKSVCPGFRSRFLFKAQVPAMGYKAFRVIKTEEDIVKGTKDDLFVHETERYKFVFDREGGNLASVTDKKSGAELAKNILRPACFIDDGETWAFNITEYGEECEPFTLVETKLTECGIHRTTIRMTYKFRESKLWMYYTFYEDTGYVDVRYRVNFNEKHLVLKLVSDIGKNGHVASIPYGVMERGEKSADMPMGEWLKTDNIAFIADSIFAYNMIGGRLGLTVLRAPIYGDLRRMPIDLEEDYDIHAQGITEGRLRVVFDGHMPVEYMATEFNAPNIIKCESNHGGEMPSCGGNFTLDGDVSITAVKLSEDDASVIVRGVELWGKAGRVSLTLCGESYTFEAEPYEIFTLKLANGKAVKVNMLEE